MLQVAINYDMNLAMQFNLPKKPRTYFSVHGSGILRIAFTLFGSTSIAFWLMTKPKNFLDFTSNVHFVGFSLNLYLRSHLNNFRKWTRCSSSVLDLVIMSSM